MTPAEIIRACLETGDRAAWELFVRHFQPLIASSVSRVCRGYGAANPALIDDLVQETYVRLCSDDCRNLRNFTARHDEAIFGYLKVIATSVALDHFRVRGTQKRRGEVQLDGDEYHGSTTSSPIEHNALLKELEKRLASTENERDCAIFWLYYRQGYTAKDISTMPHVGLTQKGVESCIYRLTQSLRSAVSDTTGLLKKGKSSQSTLGVIK